MDGDYTLYTGVRGISIGTWTSVYGFTGPFVLGWGAFHVRLLCMLVTIYLRSYIVEDSSMGGSRIEALFRQLHVPFPVLLFLALPPNHPSAEALRRQISSEHNSPGSEEHPLPIIADVEGRIV